MAEILFRDDGLTLELQCRLDASRAALWRCWTEPGLLKQWLAPAPWRVAEADFDLKPGGRMNTLMQGPDGTTHDNQGVWLEIVEGERLRFTDAYREGFAPVESGFMTSTVTFADAENGGAEMVWGARHPTEEKKQAHLAMGFEAGWSAGVRQLETLAQSLDPAPRGFASTSRKARTCLWFEKGGLAAAEFYVSLLPGSFLETVSPMGRPDDPLYVTFTLAGAPMSILAAGPTYALSPAVSIAVTTADQAETDRLWSALLATGGEESQCGWLTDGYGVSWQITPAILPRLMDDPDRARAGRVQAAMMSMKKIDIAALEAAAAATE